MSFQVGIGSLSGTVFFQVGLCTPLRTMALRLLVPKLLCFYGCGSTAYDEGDGQE